MAEEILKEEELKGIEKYLAAAAPEFNVNPKVAVSLYLRALTLQADENRRVAEEQTAAIKTGLSKGAKKASAFARGFLNVARSTVEGAVDSAKSAVNSEKAKEDKKE